VGREVIMGIFAKTKDDSLVMTVHISPTDKIHFHISKTFQKSHPIIATGACSKSRTSPSKSGLSAVEAPQDQFMGRAP
jgi:hypothetical protein